MKKSIIAVTLILPLVTVLVLSPILVNQAFAQNQMGIPMMSPRQQWMMTNTIDDITCREGKVLMVRGANATPACVSPTAYLRLADRGWGNFDLNMMANNPQQMQRVMNGMMNNPQIAQNWQDMMANNPQQIQNMVDQMTSSMMKNPKSMGPMMNTIMNDPEFRQQMVNMMMTNPQMMDTMRGNNQMMNIMRGGMMNQGMTGMMNDPDISDSFQLLKKTFLEE